MLDIPPDRRADENAIVGVIVTDMDRLIFLDVDGVLNSMSFAKKMLDEEGVRVFREDILDRRCLLLLKDIVDKTGAKIVVSSAWRRIPRAFQHLKEWLEQYSMEVYDVTPYVGVERGNDITAWFNRNPGEYRYVILDDDSDMTTHMEHLVHTNFHDRGLTRSLADRCIAILNSSNS